ncbi:MAG: hypothetical protein IMZ50_14305 [Candidatus Atribacteria bacterium]|nr:hypothetical protein [Planctomycetota bacterium]MBE3119911.1 hypothetical protein [Candidatus Atribacteria bacterium]
MPRLFAVVLAALFSTNPLALSGEGPEPKRWTLADDEAFFIGELKRTHDYWAAHGE